MFCKLIIVGNLGRDPEMRYTPSGQPVTQFSVATNRRWTDRETNEPKEETTLVPRLRLGQAGRDVQ